MTDVRHAADNALRLLSELQLETGCYSSYGVQNPESAAQVVTALSALGNRSFFRRSVIKGNNTLFDAIMAYQLDDGGFEHTLGGGYNQNATVQVFYSMVQHTDRKTVSVLCIFLIRICRKMRRRIHRQTRKNKI